MLCCNGQFYTHHVHEELNRVGIVQSWYCTELVLYRVGIVQCEGALCAMKHLLQIEVIYHEMSFLKKHYCGCLNLWIQKCKYYFKLIFIC